VILEAVPDEPVDIARKGLEAYQRGDVDAVFEVATDDVEFIVPDSMANSGTYVGRAGFETMMRQWEEAWDEFQVEVVELLEEEDAVAVSVVQYGRGRGSGIETRMTAAYLMRFRDGRLSQWRLFPSLDEALRDVRNL
jgi:ketosteroid isomerase-like protein